jgi:NTE family protein
MSERIVEAFVTAPPLNDYTLPLVAITRGLKVDRALARHFGDARIEDLWHPFFCVSTNLSTGAALVHRRGPLARALRASVAIPGLLPPVLAPEGVLVDGAMINNLPVDVIAGIDRGRILAVDVASDVAMLGTPRRSWRNQILRRWLDVPHAMPGVTEILLRAATVSSDLQANLARAQASLVIRPPLADVDLRAWRSYERIARIGYEHTSRMIEAGLLTALAPTGPMAAAVGPLRD